MPRLLPHHVKVRSEGRPVTSRFSLNENNGAPRARDSQGQAVYNTGTNNNTGTKVGYIIQLSNYLSVLTSWNRRNIKKIVCVNLLRTFDLFLNF